MKKLLALMLCILSGCSGHVGVTEENIESKRVELEQLTQSRIVTVTDAPYLGARPVRLHDNPAISSGIFTQNITLNQRGTLPELCATVSSMTGLPISAQDSTANARGGKSANSGNLDMQLKEALGIHPGQAIGAITTPKAERYHINYSGTVKGLLGLLSAKSGLAWEYSDEHGVSFAAAVIKTFTIWAAPGRVTFKNTITNQTKESASSSGSGGVSVQDASMETSQANTTDLTFDVWKDVEAEVKALLSPSGSVSMNQAAGTITVRDTPYSVQQISHYITALNEKLARQVALSIKVWNLEIGESGEVGLNLSLFFENPDVKVFTGGASLLSGGGELSAAIVDGKLKDSTALLKGLRSIGNATQVTSGGGVFMSNQPVPIQAIRRDAYLAGSTRTQNDYGDSTTLTPGEFTTGFAMTVIPHILENRRVVLQYTINLSSLDAMEEFSSGDSTIQLPKISTRSFSQRMTLKVGQTLILAGFEQESDGKGHNYGFLGAGVSREYKKSLIVITISTEAGDV